MSSRLKQFVTITTLGFVLLLSANVFAQDSSERALAPGVAVSSVLDSANVAQVYTLAGTAGQSITITVAPETQIQLSLLLTDNTGSSLGQATSDAADVPATLSAIALPVTGTYYVTVLAASGIPEAEATFNLSFEVVAGGTATAAEFIPPGELLTVTGIQFELSWNTASNLDLEVRDPVGGSLYWERPTVASGGQFGVNVNGACDALNSDTPSEQASWPAGVIPTGSYELIVYYQQQQDCPNANPANLTLSATVDGKAITPIEGTLQPGQIYLASMVVQADGSVSVGSQGVKVDPPSAVGLNINDTIALSGDAPVSGVISSAQPYQTYGFSGQAGQVVSVQMDASSGNLDTLLLLLDPNGNLVATNDDREQGVTNSGINNFSLILSGGYKVVATRYGQALGGTEGEYTLTLSGALPLANATQSAQIPAFPNLPRGSVEVSLQWSTNADIQLLVRDPQGAAVYDDKPQIPSGGTLAANGNNNCQVVASGSPLSYIYWPEGRLPTAGPYEIELLYQSACNDNRPLTFSLNVVANGQLIVSKSEVLRLDERYVVSFNIGLDGQITAGDGGVFGTKQRPDAASILTEAVSQATSAVELSSDETVTGSIRLNRKFDIYIFDGTAGQVATIGMEQLNGTLDSVLFLIGPGGDQITQNDDASRDTRNSVISNFPLPVDGQYIVIATHFGGRYGVTAGDYRLTLRLN
jgi:hypothetical protein